MTSAMRSERAIPFACPLFSTETPDPAGTIPNPVANPGLVERIVADLARNFGEQLTLRDMGSASGGYSVYQIIRAFRRRLGTTPHAYLMRMRVDYAASRIAEGDSIAGVAAEAGFADQSHMTRHFKRVYGTTPKQFVVERSTSDKLEEV